MRLKKLTINNFGIYKDEHSFSFPYSPDKKISLIIGKNGAGKTTFLNAIKICLFGSMMLKNKTITKNYEAYILDRLNKDALKEKKSKFSIKAIFISQVHNYDGEFTIERTWDTANSFKEDVYMSRNNKSLTKEEQNSFFNAFYHAFPLDLFELFYLDGEKIDELSVLNSNIFTLIESSINIDLFKKLRSDLLTYATKRVNSSEIDSLTETKIKHELELNYLNETIKDGYNKIDYSMKNMDIKADEIKNLKDSLNIYKLTTDSTQMKNLELNIVELKKDIEIELIQFLPYSLITEQITSLLNNISKENDLSKNSIINTALQSKELSNYLSKENLDNNFQLLLEKICSFYPTTNDGLIHKLSYDDYYSLKNKINHILEFNRNNLYEKIKELDNLENQHSLLSREASDLEAIKASGQLDSLLKLQSDFDNFKISQEYYQEEIKTNKYNFEKLELELKSIENSIWTQLKKSNISSVIDQINNVLEQYIIEIKSKKINQIEYHTKKMFDLLIRKKEFINDFKIENDSIYLLDKNNNRLNQSNLSAGEKQIFVLSILYAVLQSSERKVPLMFDTFLGRLDEEHRDNVFKEFIRLCPDQVIILATDSELANIDKEYLSSITNIEYNIDFSKDEYQMSEVKV